MTPKRTSDPAVIEHRLLELAYTTDAKISAQLLAYFAPCSIEDAEKVLDDLTARNRLQMEVHDDGTLIYNFPDRQRLQPPHAIEVPPRPTPFAIRGNRDASPGLAALLSTLLPGAGQAYTGRWLAGLLWLLVVSAGYTLLLPGLILHLLCIVSAASYAHRLNSIVARLQLEDGV